MKDFNTYLKETGEVGYVQAIMSSIFYVSGLPSARLNELVITENGLIGIVKAVLPELIEVMIFEGQTLSHNMKVIRTNEQFQVPVSDSFLGRVIDPFGVPQDEKGAISEDKIVYREVDPPAPGILQRVRIAKPLKTGVMIVDLLVPIGRGQRELVLGDQKTGKTTFALQTMVNQVRMGTLGVYVCVGKKKSDLKAVQGYLLENKVLDKVVLVAATSSDPAPMVYLAPLAGLSIAEHFRDAGHEVLVIFDDLTTHAKFYREISLLSRRPPGRQSYPGDIFHIHACLTERAGNIKIKDGREVSISLLPLAETLEGDLSGYIQSNIMAMTDGHIFFDIAETKRGKHPSVSTTLSVSRVGNQTRTPMEREIADELTQKLSEARKAEELGKFGVELTEETMKSLKNAEKMEALFNQESNVIYEVDLQNIFLGLFLGGFWDRWSGAEIRGQKKLLYTAYNAGTFNSLRLKLKDCKDLAGLIDLVSKNLKILIFPQQVKVAAKKIPLPSSPQQVSGQAAQAVGGQQPAVQVQKTGDTQQPAISTFNKQ